MTTFDLFGAEFRKSSHSVGGNDCVEVATNLPNLVAVRDSKDPYGPMLTFTSKSWNDFLTGIRADAF
ncbi:DUF397 domain-containing protein [Streptosporangium sp. NPDC000095]|uniref:DUF397 domain-containing protein n=1 Tax=Streptosporangium sp. NPDC000095 TaxID=3366184 RepID=UPI0036B95C1A